MSWRDHANCKGHYEDYVSLQPPPKSGSPPKQWKEHKARLIAICDICPVKDECYIATKTEPFGVWGGVYRNRDRDFTRREAKLHCSNNHAYTPETVIYEREGDKTYRRCLVCRAEREERRRRKNANKQQPNEHVSGLPSEVELHIQAS